MFLLREGWPQCVQEPGPSCPGNGCRPWPGFESLTGTSFGTPVVSDLTLSSLSPTLSPSSTVLCSGKGILLPHRSPNPVGSASMRSHLPTAAWPLSRTAGLHRPILLPGLLPWPPHVVTRCSCSQVHPVTPAQGIQHFLHIQIKAPTTLSPGLCAPLFPPSSGRTPALSSLCSQSGVCGPMRWPSGGWSGEGGPRSILQSPTTPAPSPPFLAQAALGQGLRSCD